ncbi:MAG: ATP-binding cassette domain-containing protein [Tissierellia bacterium]|nr:ATP-binding cassette domain-containing protein [Tissierellia bacterium]
MEKGKHYAFVGSNGAGKSTIIKMLTGQYTDYEGQILIDGKDIQTLSQSQLKSLFSVIYQDFSQYEISLKDNILLGDLAKTHRDEEVTGALTQAGLRELVEELPNGIETTLGRIDHSGMDVSGGQWQKIVFARSIMSPAPIKILDEPTAALDPLSENRLYLQYKEIMKGKTTIFISHRLASTKLADKIFVIDNGVIVQRGQYEELVTREGIYRDMFEEQSRWYSQ